MNKAGRMPMDDELILADGVYAPLEGLGHSLNDNVLIVGASGSGKTWGIVTPNLLQASGSYIVSDPKGNLYDRYGDYLRQKGYRVRLLDFIRPERSCHYNPFHYIHTEEDIVTVAHAIIYAAGKGSGSSDPFWDEAAEILLSALIGYILKEMPESRQNFSEICSLLELCRVEERCDTTELELDALFHKYRRKHGSDDLAFRLYQQFRSAAGKTMQSIVVSTFAALGTLITKEMQFLMNGDTLELERAGEEKTALFVSVSDVNRSRDVIANIFFTQAMQTLVYHADHRCRDCRLPVPVRFILDDFATNVNIAEFPRMIASIRSRGISAMLIIQAESQLGAAYGEDGRTIISNCDTYVYLGSNDMETVRRVAFRADVPEADILNMPAGSSWIFRRGEKAVRGRQFPTEEFIRQKKEEAELEAEADSEPAAAGRKGGYYVLGTADRD